MGLQVDKEATEQAKVGKYQAGKKRSDWWNADKASVGNALKAWCDGIERMNWPRRWALLTYYRYMTGRASGPSSFNFAATARPGAVQAYARAQFAPPRYNVMGQCSDALANRVYKARPFLQACPIDGDSTARFNARYITRFLDGSFYDLDIWDHVELCGEDSRIWGDGFLKIDATPDRRIDVTRILSDEVIIDENEANAGKPKRYAIRIFMNREDAISQYGINDEAIAAINNAPKANNGFYFGGDIDFTDVIVLREAWSVATKKLTGRHVMAADTFVLLDEKYHKDHPPLAKLPFKKMSTGYFAKGMAEMGLGLQREIDRVSTAAWENFRRAAWPRIGIAQGSNVDPAKLGDKSNGLYYYAGTAPKFDFPMAMSPDQFRYLEDCIRRLKELYRLNDQLVQGQKPRLTSGVAVTKQDEIDDAAHIDLALHLEDFVEQIGTLIIEAAEKAKPKVVLPGRNAQLIDWNNLKWSDSSFFIRAFPMGRLSQSMAVRQQQIDTWHAEGAISLTTKKRLEQVPDTDGYLSLANAAGDFVEQQIDNMVEHGQYEPPEPWVGIADTKAYVQMRYLFERTVHTPQNRLDLILNYISALEEMEEDITPDAPAPAVGNPFGMAGPATAPAPSPFPQAPGMAAPAMPAV